MAIARIDSLKFKFGRRSGSGPTDLPIGPVTVLVGPNNGGKSRTLQDLHEYAAQAINRPSHPSWEHGVILESVEMGLPQDLHSSLEFLAPRTLKVDENSVTTRAFPFSIVGGLDSGIAHFSKQDLDPNATSPESVGLILLGHHAIWMNGRERFNLADPTQSGPLNGPPTSHWMAIERDNGIYDEVDGMIQAAFERHLIVQSFAPSELSPALSDDPQTAELRHSTTPEAIAFQEAATPLRELSDGVKVFCGLVAAVATVPHLLLLIDEPEAFLHPTLSRRLGADLARLARERDARLICATHSADFLLGCLSEVPNTTVVRLDYRQRVPTAHVLDSDKVSELSRDPLLRSADALDALFARSAVICESDADRAFYEEINRRLFDTEGRSGALDSVFLNAQNWQTTVRLAQPLRQAGVPAAVVVDLDTLAKDDAWSDFVAMAGLGEDDRQRILDARADARDAINDCGKVSDDGPLKVKINGLQALDDDQRASVDTAIEELKAIGIFVVPAGELERWLSQFGCTNKKTWVTDIFTRLGTPGDGAYVPPGEGDVWEFIESIVSWIEDPSRLGMP